MSIPIRLEFYNKEKCVSTYPATISYGSITTPFEYMQEVFDGIQRYNDFIIMSDESFDRISVQWPDGTKYTWEAILLKNAFRLPDKIRDRLILE